MNFKALRSELLGTFFLVGFGTLVNFTTRNQLFGTQLLTALAFGLTLIMLIFAFGKESGGHFNPAVSFAFLIRKEINLKTFLQYILTQLIGALLGVVLVGLVTDQWQMLSQNQLPMANPDLFDLLKGLLFEAILTFLLVLTIFKTTKDLDTNKFAGLIIGFTLTVLIIVGYNITGGSLNPFRSLAPAIFVQGEALKQIWIYILGPILGAFIATLFIEKE